MRNLWSTIVLGAVLCTSYITAFELPGTHKLIVEDTSDLHFVEQPHQLGDPATALATYNLALDAVDKTYNVIKNIFSSKSSTTLIEKQTKLSFDQLSTESVFRKFEGVAEANLMKVMDVIKRGAEIPAARQAEFADFFDLADVVDSQTFQLNNNGFNKENNGWANYLTFLYTKMDDTQKYTIFTMKINANFHIADDVFMWQKEKSTFGGMFQKTEQYLEKRSHNTTPEEAEMLMSFFDMVALKHFKEQLKQIIDLKSGNIVQASTFLE